MKRLAILGSTGSVGKSTLSVVREHNSSFCIEALSSYSNMPLLVKQVEEFAPSVVCVGSESAYHHFKELSPNFKGDIFIGKEGLLTLASLENVDMLVLSLVGSLGLEPLLEGLKYNKDIAFVNKESLVMGGSFVMDAVASSSSNFIPVDSEHSAIYQCLMGENNKNVLKVVLTSSGGPFLSWRKEEIAIATPDQAINHPRWKMGAKISVDSATLMNKGLEVIEAYWLFGLSLDNIEVIIHPESLIHALVEFQDKSVKAQLAISDMRIPLLYALSYPDRIPLDVPSLSLTDWKKLHFEEVDHNKFPLLNLCYYACSLGGAYPTVINAANEVAVDAFLKGNISFFQIADLISDIVEGYVPKKEYCLEEIFFVDKQTRLISEKWVKKQSMYVMGDRS